MKFFKRHSRGTYLALVLILTSTIGTYGHAQAGASWPNEPPGLTVLTDQPFNGTLPGWGFQQGTNGIQTDATAPLSPSNVLRFDYPNGFKEGNAPGQWWFAGYGTNVQEIYTGFWWKISPGWQQATPQIGKIFYLQPSQGGSPNIFWGFTGANEPYGITAQLQDGRANPLCNLGSCGTVNFFENVGHVNITSGTWYRIEAYLKKSTTNTSQNGIIKTWINGTQVISYTNVNFDSSVGTFDNVNVTPVYGGVGGVKTQNDYMYFDHWHVSAPSGASADSVPPSTPVGLAIR